MHHQPGAAATAGADHIPVHGVALVVGASRGLGLRIADELARRDYLPVLVARDAQELDAAQEQLGGADRVRTYVADVADEAAMRALVEWAERELGSVEVSICVAGVIQVGPAEAMELQHFREAIDTMLWGPIHVALAVLPGMRRRGHGRIGTVASIGGMVSPPHLLPYATAKFGAVGFSDGLAASLAGSGVTATTIVPGLMRTGSQERAEFTGDAGSEYAWFAPAASMPLVSMDDRIAAGRIVDGVLAGSPMVVLTPLAWLGIRVRGLIPGTTTRVMGIANRLLPAAAGPGGTVEGRTARQRLRDKGSGGAARVVDALTVLGRRAAERNNERAS